MADLGPFHARREVAAAAHVSIKRSTGGNPFRAPDIWRHHYVSGPCGDGPFPRRLEWSADRSGMGCIGGDIIKTAVKYGRPDCSDGHKNGNNQFAPAHTYLPDLSRLLYARQDVSLAGGLNCYLA